MKKVLFIFAFLIALSLAFFLLKDSQKGDEAFSGKVSKVDMEMGLKFEYKSGLGGYRLDQIPVSVDNNSKITKPIRTYRLMLESDYEEMEGSDIPREGPPVIMVSVFSNPLKQSVSQWVYANPGYSNLDLLVGEVNLEAVLSGMSAVSYKINGLYQTDVVVASYAGNIYLFSGSYLEENSQIKQDFQTFLASVEFVQI